jgi:hypothetical protein
MSDMFTNPYGNTDGQWLRGNFHHHSSEASGCAHVPLAESVARYAEAGAQFIAVTDHDVVTDLDAMRAAHPDVLFINGFEYSSCENMLFIGESVPPLYERPLPDALARASDLLTVVCHPTPDPDHDYWTLDKLTTLGAMPDGVEVYNGHYGIPRMLDRGRSPCFTAFWDRLLTAGHRLWGFASDDFHDPEDFGNAFCMVLVAERTVAAVIDAAKRGRLYGSTGLLLEAVTEDAGCITVRTASDCSGRFIGPGREVLAEAEGRDFSYAATSEAYVRFEGEGEAGRLFLQPMFCM